MPDFRVSGDKPMRPHDHLGLDIEIDRQALPQDNWAAEMLREIGAVLTRAASQANGGGQERYLGSLAIHFSRTEGDSITGKYNISTMMQFETGDLNEGVINAGLSNLVVEFKRRMGRKHSTVDTKDRRGQGDL